MSVPQAILNWCIDEYNKLPGTANCCSRTRKLSRIIAVLQSGEILSPSDAEKKIVLENTLNESWLKFADSNQCNCEDLLKNFENKFGKLLDHPQERLASYGTLRPGESNHHIVSMIKGTWIEGTIRGDIFERRGYPVFSWKQEGPSVPVLVLVSQNLEDHIAKVDEFEGEGYRRILVPVHMNGKETACCVYADSHENTSAACTGWWSR